MKPAGRCKLVLVTAPDLATARRLARAAVEARLAGCASLVPKIESHYRWRGKIEHAAEILLLFKTTAARLPGLEELILARHPYETPEILALEVSAGNRGYLDWLLQSCTGTRRTSSS